MANFLSENLQGRVVVIRERVLSGTNSDYRTRLFLCEKGNGMFAQQAGQKIFGRLIANPAVRKEDTFEIDAQTDIERLAAKGEVGQ